VIGAGVFRRQQYKHKIDRLAIDGIEIDRRAKPCKQAIDTVQGCDLAMRNGNALPDPRRAQLLALQQVSKISR
jgi:hypothetical protein